MSEPRWANYVLDDDDGDDDVAAAWTARLDSGAQIALVMGVGFDPRMCMALRKLVSLGAKPQIHAVSFNAPSDEHAQAMASANHKEFARIVGAQKVHDLVVGGDGLGAISRSAAGAIVSLDQFGDATDVVVDLNALPRTMFFPMLAKLLYLCDRAGDAAPNLHVVAGDAAWIDRAITTEGLDEDASWLHPFEGTFGVETTEHIPRLWIPILGENTDLQLRRILDLVKPAEICPMLPFPARDPRRGDELFEEYLGFLFEQLRADSGTVIYAAEANPFQVYRRLRDSTLHHAETFAPLGGCNTAYSALSSKLVALGAFLVAYELRDGDGLESIVAGVGVADIGRQLHVVDREISLQEAAADTTLVSACLSGDSYL